MKKVFIVLVMIIAAIGCEKVKNEPTHSEIMRQMATDTLASIDTLFAAIVYNPQGEMRGFYWNSPEYYCASPNGSCDTTILLPEKDTLRIIYSIHYIDDYTARYNIPIPYSAVDSFTSTVDIYERWGGGYPKERECFNIYTNEDVNFKENADREIIFY
ncbi:MAG: hypothetical protein JXA98_07135 [Methanosarcinaceae archaeon]|nr:hypothetical protein [Methanosarcinaceae archaeon]